MIAVLTTNEKDVRMKGFSDNDLIEIYEMSVEIMRLNEEFGKQITASEVMRRMLNDFDTKKQKEHHGIYQGGGCCGPMDSPEVILRGLIPRLNETLFEILTEAPFQGEVALSSGQDPMYIKQEALI